MKENLIKIYNLFPWWIQNIVCSVEGYRISKKRYNKTFWNSLQFLEKSDKWTYQEYINYQETHLKNIIREAYSNVPYYKEIFKINKINPNDINTISDLKKLPILYKNILQKNNKLFLNIKYNSKNVEVGYTSGTTGRSLSLFKSINHQPWQWAVWWRHRRRFGIDVNDKYANFAGRHVVPTNKMGLPAWRVNFPMKQTYFSIFHLTDANLPYIVEYLNKKNFNYYSGYPSGLYVLASYLKNKGLVLENKPKAVVTGAETLLENQREFFKDTISDMVIDQYGLSEGCCNISQCEYMNYHVDMEFGIIEFLPISENEQNKKYRIIATGLCNEAMPLIRYDTGDVATLSKEKCPCGRESPVVEYIDGRIEDIIKTPDGRNVGRLDFIFKKTKNVEEAQIIQDLNNRIIVKIVAGFNYSKNDEKYIMELFRSYLGNSIKIDFEYVDFISRESNGKFRAIKSYIE